jgi:hypothetical protein
MQSSQDSGLARRWAVVAAFAVAMAWVESAVVLYIRTLVNRIEPYQADPLPLIGSLGPVELVRELATLVMLLTVGMLAGNTWRARLGYSAAAFGIWDFFYYVFLRIMCGWPHSVLDWDILFLIPLPWWGPVIAPVLIAGLMILWGILSTVCEARGDKSFSWLSRGACATGMLLALYTFMADTLSVADQGVEVVRQVLPKVFLWPWFTLALVLMAVPVARLALILAKGGQTNPGLKASPAGGQAPAWNSEKTTA